MPNTEQQEEPIEIDEGNRGAATYALNRWCDDCEKRATRAWSHGRGGHIGELRLRASVSDDGISLLMTEIFEEEL